MQYCKGIVTTVPRTGKIRSVKMAKTRNRIIANKLYYSASASAR